MRRRAIYTKEWLKLKWFLPALCVAAPAAVANFWFELDFAFANIEPESMMWYRFAQLEDKPYSYLAFFFPLCGAVIACCQYLPEAMQNRVRILIHLPVPLRALVRYHLLAGGLALLAVSGLFTLLLAAVISRYYPPEIVAIAVKDCLFWILPALILYLGLSAVIIERSLWRKWLKLLPTLLIALLYFKDRYHASDLILIAVLLWLLLPVYDSFLSVKTLRLKTLLYRGGALAVFGLILFSANTRYRQDFVREFQKFYIFYSPILEEFVYQRNGKGHQFEYGTAQTRFDRSVYEEALPFVYWKNRDIQGRLPVTIDGIDYGKEQIRNARLSLQYQPSRLEQKEVALYPFFNPLGDKGVISFPEEILAFKNDRVVVYDCESVQLNTELTDDLNRQLAATGVSFPISGVWGKTTNMKPFDWGYFIKDAKGQVFNLRRGDNQTGVEKISLPENAGEIVYMQVSENRQKDFYGYAITADSRVFLVGYPDYRFIPLELENFDHRRMSFHLIADPLHYLVRYDDRSRYRAALFSKDYKLLKTVEYF